MLAELLGKEELYTISGTLLKSDFFLQGLGVKTHIVIPDYNQLEMPFTLAGLLREGLRGDVLAFSKKHDPFVYNTIGGIHVTITSNELPQLKGDALQLLPRILFVKTGTFRDVFVGVDLKAELTNNLPAIVSWIMCNPTESLFITPFASSASMITNPSPNWCSVTEFVYSNRDKFLVHPSFSTPLGIQGSAPGASFYNAYQAHCNTRGIPIAEQVRVNSIKDVITEVFAKTFFCPVTLKTTRNGSTIFGLHFHATTPKKDPPAGTTKLDVHVPLHVAVLHTLDPFENNVTPMYKLPPQFVTYLFHLKEARCPLQFTHLLAVREAFLSGRLNTIDENIVTKPILTSTFEQFLHRSSRIKETKVSNMYDILGVHRSLMRSARGSIETETLPSIPEERREGVAKLLDETNLPLVPLDVLFAVFKQPITHDEKEQFKHIYGGSFSEWEAFWSRPSVRGSQLELKLEHGRRPRLCMPASLQESVLADSVHEQTKTATTKRKSTRRAKTTETTDQSTPADIITSEHGQTKTATIRKRSIKTAKKTY